MSVKKIANILCLLTLLIGFAACDEYPVESVVLNPTSLSLDVGEQDTIEVRVYPLSSAYANTVKWQSSDESVAVVSAKGVVTAVYSGKCTITATAGKQSATCEVVVNDLDYDLTFDRATALYYGDAYNVGTNNFVLRMLGSGLSLDNEGALVGEGLFVNIDMNVPQGNLSVPAGSYSVSASREDFTFAPGTLYEESGVQYATGTFVGQRAADGLRVVFIETGTFWIKQTGDSYTCEAHFVGSRNEDVAVRFSGKIDVLDRSGDTPPVTYAFETQSVTQQFLGDAYAVGLNALRFTAADADTLLQFDLYVPLSVSDRCPNGHYEFAGARAYSVAAASFTYGAEVQTIASGEVVVAQTEAGQTFQCTFVDKTGRIIDGHFVQ
ncbi:MAG: Ig-like domain-containing protein [Paludibacteraceae bacterium]